MKKIIILLFFIFLQLVNANGQMEEIKYKELDKLYTIINLGKNGLALEHWEEKFVEWIFYDSDLYKQKSSKYIRKTNTSLYKSLRYYDSIKETLYIFQGKLNSNNELLIIPIKTKEIQIIKLKTPCNLFIKSVIVFENKFFFESIINEVNNDPDREDLYSEFKYGSINIEDGTIDLIKLPENLKSSKIKAIEKINSKYLAITYFNSKTKLKNIAIMDENGKIVIDKLIKEAIISPYYNFNITNIANNQFFVNGVYFKNEKAYEPEGLFLAKFDNFNQIFIKNYSFKEYANLEKHRPLIKERLKDLFVYRTQVHPLYLINNNFIITVEFSFPRVYNVDARECQNFNYTHYLFLLLNENGEIESSDCIQSNKLEYTYHSEKILNVKLKGSEINYTYFSDNKVHKIVFKDGIFEKEKPLVQIENMHESDDLILDKNYLEFKHWYDNYYYGFMPLVPNKKYTFTLPTEYYPLLIKYELN
ncbi:MAG: hypothetical protein ACKVQB_02570 [Bacteroidia bacterium]